MQSFHGLFFYNIFYLSYIFGIVNNLIKSDKLSKYYHILKIEKCLIKDLQYKAASYREEKYIKISVMGDDYEFFSVQLQIKYET